MKLLPIIFRKFIILSRIVYYGMIWRYREGQPKE